MIDRMIDISDEAAYLKVRNEQLIIERKDRPEATVPLADLAVLIVSHPSVAYTHAVLAGITERGGAVVICDRRHLPVGMLLPLEAHYVQAERFIKQTELSLPVKKRLWQQLVRAKITEQGRVLKELHGNDHGLFEMAGRVGSGDPQNLEAQAARRYWPILFDDPNFRRRREAPDQNAMLNYGYAILRGAVARALCGAGLHPSFGLNHHNRYNAFCLADDVMEPFRPLVDQAVAVWTQENGAPASLGKMEKRYLLEQMTGRFKVKNESRALFDVLARVASSLVEVCDGKRKSLVLPEA